ncbi:MAG: hypothetical protein ACE5HT_10635 [Gemmatimonadales bacterium]
MPVMGKLSKQFYEKFGEQVTNESVDWLNQVDTTYRNDLKEFNELNFARSDAKMEQRLAEFSVALDRRLAKFEAKLNARMVVLEEKLNARTAALEKRLNLCMTALERRMDALESQFCELRADFKRLERGINDRFETTQARLDGAMAVQKASLIKWVVGLYLVSMLSMAALVKFVG